ncbi:TetR-like C-terminal domain-containing protein [Kitasatospora sp. NPDC001660]
MERGTIYRGIIAEAQSDPELAAALRATMLEPRIQRCVRRLDAAVAAGQLRADLPTRTMVDILYAPVYYRIFLGAGPDETLRSPSLVPTVLEGLSPPPAARCPLPAARQASAPAQAASDSTDRRIAARTADSGPAGAACRADGGPGRGL